MGEHRFVPQEVSTDPQVLMAQLAADAAALDAAGDELARLLREFEGTRGQEIGLSLQWKAKVRACTLEVERETREAAKDPDLKLPASMKDRGYKMIEMEGLQRAETENHDLFLRYCDMEADIAGMRDWIRSKERASSLRQSVLSAQKTGALMG